MFAVTALIVVYFLVTFAANAIRSNQLGEQEARLQAEIDDLQERYQRLQSLEEYLRSDEYVESVAREQLGLVHKGETAIVVLPAQPTPTPAPGEAPTDLWWDILVR